MYFDQIEKKEGQIYIATDTGWREASPEEIQAYESKPASKYAWIERKVLIKDLDKIHDFIDNLLKDETDHDDKK